MFDEDGVYRETLKKHVVHLSVFARHLIGCLRVQVTLGKVCDGIGMSEYNKNVFVSYLRLADSIKF